MNKNELIAAVARATGMSRRDAAKAVDATLGTIVKALRDKDDVRLTGFGTYSLTRRNASQGRNPRTGQLIRIPASNRVKFKVSNVLRMALGPHGTGGGRGR